MSQHLKDHTDMGAVDTADLEVVEKLDAARPEGILLITLPDLQNKKFLYYFSQLIMFHANTSYVAGITYGISRILRGLKMVVKAAV